MVGLEDTFLVDMGVQGTVLEDVRPLDITLENIARAPGHCNLHVLATRKWPA
jgi:hypothetical protein